MFDRLAGLGFKIKTTYKDEKFSTNSLRYLKKKTIFHRILWYNNSIIKSIIKMLERDKYEADHCVHYFPNPSFEEFCSYM